MINKVCKNCKTTLNDFYQMGLVGCPECYIYFRGEIQNAIKEVQEETFHLGKVPTFSESDRLLLADYKRKLAKKEKAIIAGDFSQVADLSNEIYVLLEELKNRGVL